MWIGRASINQAEPEGFRGGRDRGMRVVKDRGEGDDGAGSDGGTAGGSEEKKECGWRGGEERRRARLLECWGERWTVG